MQFVHTNLIKIPFYLKGIFLWQMVYTIIKSGLSNRFYLNNGNLVSVLLKTRYLTLGLFFATSNKVFVVAGSTFLVAFFICALFHCRRSKNMDYGT